MAWTTISLPLIGEPKLSGKWQWPEQQSNYLVARLSKLCKFTLGLGLLLRGATLTYSKSKEKLRSAVPRTLKYKGYLLTRNNPWIYHSHSFPSWLPSWCPNCFVSCRPKGSGGSNVWPGLQWLLTSFACEFPLEKVIKIRFGFHCQDNKDHFIHGLASTEILDCISSEHYNILGSFTLVVE